MDFNEFRDSGIQRFLRGNADELAKYILDNNLNKIEREFLADFVRSNIPRGTVKSGPKRKNSLRFKAGLIRFWQEQDGYKKKTGVTNYIGTILDCSRQRVEKILKEIDAPKTVEQAELAFILEWEIKERKLVIGWGEPKLIASYRKNDLQPIIQQ